MTKFVLLFILLLLAYPTYLVVQLYKLGKEVKDRVAFFDVGEVSMLLEKYNLQLVCGDLVNEITFELNQEVVKNIERIQNAS